MLHPSFAGSRQPVLTGQIQTEPEDGEKNMEQESAIYMSEESPYRHKPWS